MKDTHLCGAIALALLTALVGIVILAALGRPVPDSLPYVATAGISALAMAARTGSSDDKQSKADNGPAADQ